jgi:hypothetical protein
MFPNRLASPRVHFRKQLPGKGCLDLLMTKQIIDAGRDRAEEVRGLTFNNIPQYRELG